MDLPLTFYHDFISHEIDASILWGVDNAWRDQGTPNLYLCRRSGPIHKYCEGDGQPKWHSHELIAVVQVQQSIIRKHLGVSPTNHLLRKEDI